MFKKFFYSVKHIDNKITVIRASTLCDTPEHPLDIPVSFNEFI